MFLEPDGTAGGVRQVLNRLYDFGRWSRRGCPDGWATNDGPIAAGPGDVAPSASRRTAARSTNAPGRVREGV